MAVIDELPKFGAVIRADIAMLWAAHGTTSPHQVDDMYLSMLERKHAEKIAKSRINEMMISGLIRATGLYSDAMHHDKSADWRKQRWINHSGERSFIPNVFLVDAEIDFDKIRIRSRCGEYASVFLLKNDVLREFPEQNDAECNSGDEEIYITPYMRLMFEAINYFQITRDNQPLKKEIVDWFVEQKINSSFVSPSNAEYLASFIRMPESRTGGNRPWKVRAQSR